MLKKIYRALITLQFAVAVIVTLALALIVATTLESKYDTPTAQYFVYHSLFFKAILVSLGLNIFFVAMSRWPWKKSQIHFLLAHAGILILLAGSWVTQKFGIDGSMRVEEGQSTPVVELSDLVLFVMEGSDVRSIPVPWIPPMKAFEPFAVDGLPLRVARFLTHADAQFSFIPVDAGESKQAPVPAVHFEVQGGPMRIRQDYWLWAGHPQWKALQAGPARIFFQSKDEGFPSGTKGPALRVVWNGQPRQVPFFEALGGDGKKLRMNTTLSAEPSQLIALPWKGGVQVRFLKWISNATAQADFSESRIQYGNRAPPSAIQLETTLPGVSEQSSIWLGLGERGTLSIGKREVGLAYMPRRLILPFGLTLDRFQIDRYAGTMDPSAYSSIVSVPGHEKVKISMNEPLKHEGMTFYQASYEEGTPRPTVSIFSVNRDPGRAMKYLGSLLIVAGSILLFYKRIRMANRAKGVVS